MDRQRLYDAMLIKAFRQNIKLGYLYHWLKPLGIEIPDPTLKRQPPFNGMRVQYFVGHYLKPLADRLWDTDRSEDIKTLDWMVNLDSQKTGKQELGNLKKKSNQDRRRSGVLRTNYEYQKRNNQWNVVKGTGRTRRTK